MIDQDQEIQAKSGVKNQFAWQVGAGAKYTINHKIDLNLIDYKYQNFGYAKTRKNDQGSFLKNKLKAHSFTTGITFKF